MVSVVGKTDEPLLRCKYCQQIGHTRKTCIHLTVEHDAENCTVCINRNKRKKKILWKHIRWESVLQGKTVASKMFVRSALIRKNLVVDYLEKDVMQTHLVNCLRDVFDVINEFKGKKAQAWFIKPPEKSNASGVKAFQDAKLELGEGYFESEKMQSKNATTFVLQPYLPPLLLECCNKRKFHVRALVYFVSNLHVYICKEARVLVASKPWKPSSWDDRYIHITNQSVNKTFESYDFERQNISLKDLVRDGENGPGKSLYGHIFTQMQQQTRILAANLHSRAPRKQFFPLPNTFELFGFDFIVDASLAVRFLEANPDPSTDLKFSNNEMINSANPLQWIDIDDTAMQTTLACTASKEIDVKNMFIKIYSCPK